MSSYRVPVILLCTFTFSMVQSDTDTLRFKLSAVNLPNTDLDGPSDPYVTIFAGTKGPTDLTHYWNYFGSTSTKMDTLNPEWDEEFQYSPINGTHQMWRFIIRDEDVSWNPLVAIDDPLGYTDILVQDYVVQIRKNSLARVNLSETIKAYQTHLQLPVGGAIRINPIE